MKKFTVYLLVLLLAGCESYAEKMNEYAPAAGNPDQYFGHEMTFQDHLAAEYLNLAALEHDERYDYQCAAHFTRKASKLMNGEMVGPDNPRYSRKIPAEKKEYLLAARSLLIDSIMQEGRPENRQALAKAQTTYDCWVDQAKDWSHDLTYVTCDDQFFEAMASLNEDIDFFEDEELEFFI